VSTKAINCCSQQEKMSRAWTIGGGGRASAPWPHS